MYVCEKPSQGQWELVEELQSNSLEVHAAFQPRTFKVLQATAGTCLVLPELTAGSQQLGEEPERHQCEGHS